MKEMKKKFSPRKAEKCGICFFVNNKAVFTLVKTKDEDFNNVLVNETYIRMKKYSIVVCIIPINKKKGSVWPKNQKCQV